MAARTIGIGHQDFEQLIQSNCFYIDKTKFIKEWWENQDAVTLITRPRRFGKTLTMSMVVEEVFAALDDYGMGDRKADVKRWYDGFTFRKGPAIWSPMEYTPMAWMPAA